MIEIGPEFKYELAPKIFSGRAGFGPLEIVWDTMVLLDYLEFGSALWEGEDLPIEDEDYVAELEGLNLLIQLWMVRDIRFRILDRSVTDSKKKGLSGAQIAERQRALGQVAAALRLDMWADDSDILPRRVPGWAASSKTISAALRKVPAGADRALVNEALGIDAHVFLTRDKAILRAGPDLSACGLFVASPLDLLEELTACGAFHAVLERQSMWWPFPDVQRIAHLLSALP